MEPPKPPLATRIIPFGPAAIAEAVTLLRADAPVAVATETVYGLAADATSGAAVAAIYAAKGRPSFNPLIVHVADRVMARGIATFDAVAERIADAFWPGPLTLVLPRAAGSPVASLATAGLATVAIRMPAHPAMRALLDAFGRPLAAPSANASGSISPTRASHVAASLAGRIALVIDSGATPMGLESTIVAAGQDRLRLLRPGPITVEALRLASGLPVDIVMAGDRIEAPGQLASHYAPAKPLRLDAQGATPDEFLIGFGAVTGDASLSPSGNLVEAAALLFDLLHLADGAPQPAIAVAPVPMLGIGIAINDRLARAAAPR